MAWRLPLSQRMQRTRQQRPIVTISSTSNQATKPANVRSWRERIRHRLFSFYFDKFKRGYDNRHRVFSDIYRTGYWKGAESVSGPGSDLAFTEGFRPRLADWLQRHSTEVKTLLDAPCGDFNWMRHVPFPDGLAYTGADIVPELIRDVAARHAAPGRRFMELDIVSGPIPNADAWLCRDALFHFPFAAGARVIENFRASKARYLLATTFPDARNDTDIKFGWFHKINLAEAPYSLGEPLELIPDSGDDQKPGRFIGVWLNPNAG